MIFEGRPRRESTRSDPPTLPHPSHTHTQQPDDRSAPSPAAAAWRAAADAGLVADADDDAPSAPPADTADAHAAVTAFDADNITAGVPSLAALADGDEWGEEEEEEGGGGAPAPTDMTASVPRLATLVEEDEADVSAPAEECEDEDAAAAAPAPTPASTAAAPSPALSWGNAAPGADTTDLDLAARGRALMGDATYHDIYGGAGGATPTVDTGTLAAAAAALPRHSLDVAPSARASDASLPPRPRRLSAVPRPSLGEGGAMARPGVSRRATTGGAPTAHPPLPPLRRSDAHAAAHAAAAVAPVHRPAPPVFTSALATVPAAAVGADGGGTPRATRAAPGTPRGGASTPLASIQRSAMAPGSAARVARRTPLGSAARGLHPPPSAGRPRHPGTPGSVGLAARRASALAAAAAAAPALPPSTGGNALALRAPRASAVGLPAPSARTPTGGLAAPPITFQDFLGAVDLQFLDHMRRGTSISLADLADDPPPLVSARRVLTPHRNCARSCGSRGWRRHPAR